MRHVIVPLLLACAVSASAEVPARREAIDAAVTEAASRATAAYRAGDYPAAAAAYEELIASVDLELLPARQGTVLYNLACFRSRAGSTDAALDALEAAVSAGWSDAALVRDDDDLDPLRESDRFEALVEKMAADAEREARLWSPEAIETPYSETLPVEARIAGLSRVWSEVIYAFAYFDQVPELDWHAEYLAYLPRVMSTERTIEYYALLTELMAKLEDGHTNVIYPPELRASVFARPAIRTALIESRVLVSEIETDKARGAGVSVGDELIAIDGVPVREYASARIEPYVASSTPQDRVLRTYTYELLRGDATQPVELELESATGERKQITLPRALDHGVVRQNVTWRTLPDEVGYLAINTFNESNVDSLVRVAMEELSGSRGLVIDVRTNGGGSSGWWVMRHLTDTCQTSAWSARQYVAVHRAWGRAQQRLEQAAGTISASADDRRFSGPVALLVGPRTFSAAEDFAAAFAYSGRGVVVGEATGGSTGQPLVFRLPGGGAARVCSKRDTYPDGTLFVGRGIVPDVEVSPTVADVRAGFDRALERARALVLEGG